MKTGNGILRQKPRLGFLGVGWIGRHRMKAILDSGLAEAAAIAEPSAEMRAAAAALAPGARTAASLEEMLAHDLDGIVIATPSALHAEQSIMALERGRAVFCQKPLGRTAHEVSKVVEAARQADRLLGVDLSYRHTAAMQAIKTTIAAHGIGTVFAADLVFHNAYGPDKQWFYDTRLSGGGCVMDLGIHLVDLALWALDFPDIVDVSADLYAAGVPLAGRRERTEDYAVARLTLATGAVVTLACSWRLHAGQDAVISASFYGTDGGLRFANTGGSFYDFVGERLAGTSRTPLAEPPDDWGGRAAVDWARRLASGSRYDDAAARFVTVAAALDRIYGRDERPEPGSSLPLPHRGDRAV